jgi:flagellar assembly protein FliH
VDAEEKKLSHNSETGPYPNSRTGFRLHYFPDIPVDEPDNAGICAPLEDKFQRVRYDGDESNCSDLASGFVKNETRPNRNASSDDRFDVQAYQKGVNDGLEKGTKEGEKAGFELAAKKLEPLLDSLQQGLLQLSNLRQDTYQRIEKEVVELALAIARRIICREIEVDKEVVVCVAREALSQVKDPGNIKIKLNPSDLEFINQTKYQLSELIGDINNVTLEAEEGIQSGGCLIETNLGEIDARVETQLQAVEESFRTALGKSSTKTQPG